MSCYHPFLGIPSDDINPSGKRSIKVLGKYDPEAKKIDPRAIPIPCGRCVGCRLDYSRSWADRMMLELDHSKKAVFVTLTYNNENVIPTMFDENDVSVSFTLDKRDLQLFMKRLRSRKEFENREIRFYASGEYGSKTFRPHYHAIIFGIELADFAPLKYLGTNELKQGYYTSSLLEDIWSKGFVVVTEVSWQTCAYVARYVMKKINSPTNCFEAYLNAEPEFSLMSRRPGIGAYYMQEHDDWKDKAAYYIDGVEIRMPRYFLKKLALTDPERYDKLVQDKIDFANDRIFLKMQNTDLSYIEMLEAEEDEKLLKTKILKRN